ncbi:MAG: shikimate dehydrogenase [Chlamydiota bacterium]
MLVAVLTGPTVDQAKRDLEKLQGMAAIVELRLDHFEPEALLEMGQFMSRLSLPAIFTFRKKEQGGAREITETERFSHLEKLLELNPAHCDLEADTDPSLIAHLSLKFPKVQFIGSYHNFEETPRDLSSLLRQMKNPHFSIYKIAAKANSTLDLMRMLLFAKEESGKTALCCISMGELGRASRVLEPIVGGVFTYAALDEEKAVLHRYSLKTLHEVFHFNQLSPDTHIYALIGDPVEQSPGHLYHNKQFVLKQQNAVYVKLQLKVSELPEFFKMVLKLPFKGLSVTMPLKEAILPFLGKIDPFALAIGAVNTVEIQNGITTGSNTDAPGALNAIEKHLQVKHKKVAILGAGGTARAIAYEAKRRGAEVLIYNRTKDRAEKLGAELGCRGYELSKLEKHPCDLLINTIPLSRDGALPISPDWIPKCIFVMDAVYSPKVTPLLKAAQERGCSLIFGEEMFLEQAALQQITWYKRQFGSCKIGPFDRVLPRF